MIYINENTEYMQVPKHEEHVQKPNTLNLVNNFTQRNISYTFDNSITQNEYFYKVDLRATIIRGEQAKPALITENLEVGEYTFYLQYDDEIYEKGLLVYGEYK